jgi:uncharacterized membrane protein
MNSMQSHVSQYKKLCVEYYTTQAQLTSLRNIRDSIDADRFVQQESEYMQRLGELEPQMHDSREVITNAISGQETGKEQIKAKISALENKITQEDILFEARAITRERYENIVKPLKSELAQLQFKDSKYTENIKFLESALSSCNEEQVFSMEDENVTEVYPEVVSIEKDPPNAKTWVLGVYISYLLGLLLWFTPVVGVVIAYVFQDKAGDVLQSHYQFQIRTFWISFLFGLIVLISMFLLIGFLLAPVLLIWFIVRCVVGLKYLYEDKPIPNPKSWLFGL